ncbi:MAG: hypothetical protein LKM32_01040 [Chiayiivirga sp.]|jgi:hypothetical protein|uniref:hypothetical protein n=1 Tax=Chiayiivirga sp. TaxID=2041042 RepID=UPI0025C3C219|nr:hypothetical protein [Chiayiivirga sp.]MCI1711175.1 hypothetical protein [Chiayiivirga sp.]MCI1728022.1 hypothetical protein [Chiayiivirga sp.]
MRRAISLACGLMLALAAGSSLAAEPPAPAIATSTSRFALKHPPRIEPTPQQAGRYTLKARFAREESAGELREGERFTLIGRLVKGGASCDANTLFSNGFEGN